MKIFHISLIKFVMFQQSVNLCFKKNSWVCRDGFNVIFMVFHFNISFIITSLNLKTYDTFAYTVSDKKLCYFSGLKHLKVNKISFFFLHFCCFANKYSQISHISPEIVAIDKAEQWCRLQRNANFVVLYGFYWIFLLEIWVNCRMCVFWIDEDDAI